MVLPPNQALSGCICTFKTPTFLGMFILICHSFYPECAVGSLHLLRFTSKLKYFDIKLHELPQSQALG